MCSCNKCNNIYGIRHKKTDICFAVGSTCIKRFMPELYGTLSERKNGDICINCNITLWYKTTLNNERNSSIKNKNYCLSCIKIEELKTLRIKNFEKLEKERLKKIEVDKEHLKKLRNVELKKQTILRKFGCFENNKQYLNKCKKYECEYDFLNSNNFKFFCNTCFHKS
jgi:hypothetical protein